MHTATRAPRVLIADRDRRLLTTLRRIMRNAGYETMSTTNPSQLRTMLSTEPDVLVAEAGLLPGHEAAIRRLLPRSSMTIVIAPWADTADAVAGRLVGAVTMLKPVSLAGLMSAIDEHVLHHRDDT
ncbi:MAG: response regulator transcription factor [Hamadaea sp.]|nr:response regulator transcription factor [Hamadaea sp.]